MLRNNIFAFKNFRLTLGKFSASNALRDALFSQKVRKMSELVTLNVMEVESSKSW